MSMRLFCRRTITLVAIVTLAQFAFVEPASAGRRGSVRYGGHHSGPGGPGGPGRHGPGFHGGFHAGHFHGFHVGFRPHPMFWHPVGFFMAAMTTTAIVVSLNNRQYHYDQGVYYVPADNGYEAVSAPIGAKIPDLPDDTRLWAALQQASGGTWAGCVYDVDRIVALLEAARSRQGDS